MNLRTPENRFQNLPGYNFPPHYTEIDGLRIHYVDEGSKSAPTVLMLHGEPSWGYLYRKMVSPIVDAGFRVVVPDLMGFGRSDKPERPKDYSYQRHLRILSFLTKNGLNLKNITLFVQDWGGLLGLRLVAESPDNFARIIAANTFLPDAGGLQGLLGNALFKFKIKRIGNVTEERFQAKPNFYTWVGYSQSVPEFPVGKIIDAGTVTDLSPEIIAAYEAPFPEEKYKVGARRFPMLIPTQLRQNHRAWKDVLEKWQKPFLTAFSDHDPITRGLEKILQKRIPGARNQPHVTIKDAGHFLQEDKGEELAGVVSDFIRKTE